MYSNFVVTYKMFGEEVVSRCFADFYSANLFYEEVMFKSDECDYCYLQLCCMIRIYEEDNCGES